MSHDEAPPRVAQALAALETARRDQEERQKAQLASYDAEILRLNQAVANLQAQLAAVQQARLEAESQRTDDSAEQGYHQIFQVLRSQAGQLAARGVAWIEAARALSARRADVLRNSDIAPLISEYEAFRRDVEPTLGALPASYRSVLLAHHEGIAGRLRHRLEGLAGDPEVHGTALQLDVVLSVDVDDEGGVAMIVTPVPEEVHSAWTQRDADLQTRVGARIVQGVYTALRGTPMESAQAMVGGHQGLLALEVEMSPGTTSTFGERLRAAIAQAVSDAPELRAARVEVTATLVDTELLLPPEGGEEGEDA
jgi:hypothetical protein